MDDIVERLRKLAMLHPSRDYLEEAISEIERLRRQAAILSQQIDTVDANMQNEIDKWKTVANMLKWANEIEATLQPSEQPQNAPATEAENH